MGRMLICCGKKAETPLYMKEFQISVSTIEELCYCLKKNLHMLDKNIMREMLCGFIEQQLELKTLAQQLRAVIENQEGLVAFVGCIMKFVGYLSQEELLCLEAELQEVEGQSQVMRRKAKADFWLEHKKYAKAAVEYNHILQEEVIEEEKIRGDIYHNLGTIYSRMFFFDKAAEYYQMAYEKNQDEESYECYLLALHTLDLEKKLGEALLHEAESYKRSQMQEISKYRQLGYVQEYYCALEKIFDEYKQEYRGSMSEG